MFEVQVDTPQGHEVITVVGRDRAAWECEFQRRLADSLFGGEARFDCHIKVVRVS
jgi:hypothetical protein